MLYRCGKLYKVTHSLLPSLLPNLLFSTTKRGNKSSIFRGHVTHLISIGLSYTQYDMVSKATTARNLYLMFSEIAIK